MSDHKSQLRFEELLVLFIEEQLQAQELAEFVELVKANPDFSKELQLQLEQDQLLTLFQEVRKSDHHFSNKVASAIEFQDEDFTEKVIDYALSYPKKRVSSSWGWKFLAIAASLCLSILVIYKWSDTEESLHFGVAILSQIDGELDSTYQQGDSLPAGRLELKTGQMVLTFYKGASLSVVAPAKLELLDQRQVLCLSGKIRAHVPEVAKGFTVLTPDAKVVDLGTDFGLEVGHEGQSKVHVFEGRVETYSLEKSNSDKKLILAGQAILPANGAMFEADQTIFKGILSLSEMQHKFSFERFEKWDALQNQHLNDSRLLLNYNFQKKSEDVQILYNLALGGHKYDAAIIGTAWARGPWAYKDGLSFRQASDRIRFYSPDKYRELTLACWVRVDVLENPLSSLVMSDGYATGALHWQINRNDRSIQLGIKHENNLIGKYHALGVFKDADLGKWMHLAVTIDLESMKVRHYKNGLMILERTAVSKEPVQFNYASLGNWDNPIKGNTSYVRNLNGVMAEFLFYSVALEPHEIEVLALRKNTFKQL